MTVFFRERVYNLLVDFWRIGFEMRLNLSHAQCSRVKSYSSTGNRILRLTNQIHSIMMKPNKNIFKEYYGKILVPLLEGQTILLLLLSKRVCDARTEFGTNKTSTDVYKPHYQNFGAHVYMSKVIPSFALVEWKKAVLFSTEKRAEEKIRNTLNFDWSYVPSLERGVIILFRFLL